MKRNHNGHRESADRATLIRTDFSNPWLESIDTWLAILQPQPVEQRWGSTYAWLIITRVNAVSVPTASGRFSRAVLCY